ncbi:MAG: TadE/TadG family type IV pilus assembly protein [Tractidigestivibacter sp.]|uniref:TadE/TadG family type IV pilus assembly protein n=1 Tax=Tractidigestivibacter sp. TaxID=2847320 RepID=UPI003D8ED5DC
MGKDRGQRGQATVEAAALIPVMMVVLALLMQPAMLLYTRSVMSGAAAEAARLASTASVDERDELCRSYVLRRLEAVPSVSCFHAGGKEDWQVSTSVSGSSIRIEIVGHVRPLPLMGALAQAFSERDEQGIVLRVSCEREMRADWVKGGYDDWVETWG